MERFNKKFWQNELELEARKNDTTLAVVNAIPDLVFSLAGLLETMKKSSEEETVVVSEVKNKPKKHENKPRYYNSRKYPKPNHSKRNYNRRKQRNYGKGIPYKEVRTMDRLWDIYWDTHEHNTSGEWYNGTYYSPSELDMLEFRGSDLVNDAIKAVREKQKREILLELMNE